MEIKQILRKTLLERETKKSHKNLYGCLMIYLGIEDNEWEELEKLIPNEALYEPKDDPTYGKENEPHVTILFGLHNDISDKDIEAEIKKIKVPRIELGKVSSFKNDLFEVLKFDIISDDLMKLNKKFSEFPHTTDYPNYHPHMTIAYCKKNEGGRYIELLNKYMEDNDSLVINPTKIVYSKADGTKKNYKLN